MKNNYSIIFFNFIRLFCLIFIYLLYYVFYLLFFILFYFTFWFIFLIVASGHLAISWPPKPRSGPQWGGKSFESFWSKLYNKTCAMSHKLTTTSTSHELHTLSLRVSVILCLKICIHIARASSYVASICKCITHSEWRFCPRNFWHIH